MFGNKVVIACRLGLTSGLRAIPQIISGTRATTVARQAHSGNGKKKEKPSVEVPTERNPPPSALPDLDDPQSEAGQEIVDDEEILVRADDDDDDDLIEEETDNLPLEETVVEDDGDLDVDLLLDDRLDSDPEPEVDELDMEFTTKRRHKNPIDDPDFVVHKWRDDE